MRAPCLGGGDRGATLQIPHHQVLLEVICEVASYERNMPGCIWVHNKEECESKGLYDVWMGNRVLRLPRARTPGDLGQCRLVTMQSRGPEPASLCERMHLDHSPAAVSGPQHQLQTPTPGELLRPLIPDCPPTVKSESLRAGPGIGSFESSPRSSRLG